MTMTLKCIQHIISAVAETFIRNVKIKGLQTYDRCVKKCSF